MSVSSIFLGFNSTETIPMESKFTSIEEIRSTLDRLRQDPNTKRRFPQELWNAIIQQTKNCPIEEVCSRLQINPIYLQRKIHRVEDQVLEFREIQVQAPLQSSDIVTIELDSSTGLKAKIQGPLSCLDCLRNLFGR